MKVWKLGAVALATMLGAAGFSSAPANTLQLERFGRVYAFSVCGKVAPRGQAHCYAKVVTDARGNIIDGMPNLARRAVPSGFGATDLRAAYKITAPTGAPGTGATIAIVDAYGYPNAEADLNTYRAQYGLGACTTANGCFVKVNQSGSTARYPRQDVGWAQEQALDLDMASAMCPNCKILLVQANSASIVDLGEAVKTAVRLGAKVVSNSYGAAEAGTASYESYWNQPGTVLTVSSGDYGYEVEFPAASPHVVAVGGTSLYKSGTGFSETAWSGAGSGCSTVFGILAGTQSSATTGCPNRAVADVSAVADPNTGVAVYGPVNARRSGWMVFGGTSASAPIVGGVYAVANDAPTYATTKLYSSSSSAFRDVTSGNNGTCPTLKWCTAGVGWDGPTGLGTPQTTSAF